MTILIFYLKIYNAYLEGIPKEFFHMNLNHSES